MSNQIKKSCQYILDFLRNLTSLFKVDYFYSASESWVYKFIIEYNNERLEIEFGAEIIDDFDVALKKGFKDNYFNVLESKIKFTSLIAIGEKGWLPNYLVSRDFLNEKREWLSEFNLPVEFNPELTESLYNGLNKINKSLENILQNSDLEVEAIKNDKYRIQKSIDYYERKGTLNDIISIETLSYLKASLLAEIIFLENKKKSESINRIKAEYDKKIYKLVRELRCTPFLDVKLPECINEYIIDIHSPEKIEKQISVPDYTNVELDKLLEKLDSRLPPKRTGAWETFHSNNPDRFSQSANSMVELLDQVIRLTCVDLSLDNYLRNKFGDIEEIKWAEATRKWISETKSKLNKVKHHIGYNNESLAKHLLTSSESIIFLLLK